MKRSVLVASLPHGPRNPVTVLPPRVPGSVRRTTNIDQRRTELIVSMDTRPSSHNCLRMLTPYSTY